MTDDPENLDRDTLLLRLMAWNTSMVKLAAGFEVRDLDSAEQFVVSAGRETVARWRADAKRRWPEAVALLDAKSNEMRDRVADAIRKQGLRAAAPAGSA